MVNPPGKGNLPGEVNPPDEAKNPPGDAVVPVAVAAVVAAVAAVVLFCMPACTKKRKRTEMLVSLLK